ncbi:MAG: phytanoyl-CoA dioxygenase family protein [Planctomycetota bacterium]|nr:phytanoyl-CoA dioxygenase family protein [Planctomycetota bacterium]
MNIDRVLSTLLIEGCVVLPDLIIGPELKGLQDAFERRAKDLGKRHFNWEEISLVPEFVQYIAHPKLMAVVDAFTKHLGFDAVFANSPGARESYDPNSKYEPANLRHGPLGWHDDVMGMKTPNADILQTGLSSLLYLDETFADNGAYCSAVGSHHLAHATPDKKPILAKPAFVLDNCELRPNPVKPGSVILYRAHHWHGVVPPRQQRRLVLQTFSTRQHYPLQVGHTQLSAETLKMIAPERMKYITSYAK